MVKIKPLILSISLHNDTRALQNTAGGRGRREGRGAEREKDG